MKHIRNILSTFALLFFFAHSFAQPAGRQFKEFKQTEIGFEITVSDGKYVIVPMNEKIFHITFLPEGKKLNDFSFAVSMQPSKTDMLVTQSPTEVNIDTKGIDISIKKQPFSIGYSYNGKPLISESNGYNAADSSWMLNFKITDKEILYGGGARVLGMNRRGNRLTLYNRAHYGYETHSELMNYTLPMALSSNLYAILFDNAGLGYLDLDSKKTNILSYETYSGTPNYHVIAGNDWFDLVSQYTLLTGRQPLPPRWALGNFSSRFGYHTQKETEETVDKFFKESIPLDAVIIDIYWFGKEIKGEMGNLDWYRDSFPSPDKMIKKFSKKGVNTILVTEPFILTTSKRWNEAVEKDILAKNKDGKPYTYDFYFGNTGLIDLYKPEAREWFWNIYKDLVNQGIAGCWGDLGEPEVHPADIRHAIGSGNDIHNAYGHEWAKMIFEGYKKDFPDTRPFILMRSGYAGSQRYGMIPWTGDVSRSWGGLFSQPEIALQMGMQGIGYMHSDLGGFAGGEKIDDELYVRWLQYGVFQPVFRPHAQEQIPPEPVFQAYRTKLFASDAIALRYKMLPYNYSLAFENSRTGKPLMAPLFFYEKDNPALMTYDSAYMWGDAFLVSPVKRPGEIYHEVYLPKGTNWIDFSDNKVYQGGKTIRYPVTMSSIPVFVKGGSFIPMSTVSKSTINYTLDLFEMNYYADPLVNKSTYTLYNDDGKTPDAYEKGLYELYNFTADNTSEKLILDLQKVTPVSAYASVVNTIKFNIYNLDAKPVEISINGAIVKPSDIMWNPVTSKLMFEAKCTTTNAEIIIKK
ncbi:MAG TPA: TIM-barrel domain-containing protein [Lentimicrobium sp.]|nr:TIM-barrel domain-containing protein [Lentimicrobium sp.]